MESVGPDSQNDHFQGQTSPEKSKPHILPIFLCYIPWIFCGPRFAVILFEIILERLWPRFVVILFKIILERLLRP